MESQVKAAEAAVKEYVKKWEGVSAEMHAKYVRKDPAVVATYASHAKDVENLKLAILKLDRLANLVNLVPAAAGAHGGNGGEGTSNLRILLSTVEKAIAESKKVKPPAAPPKPAGAGGKPPASPNARK